MSAAGPLQAWALPFRGWVGESLGWRPRTSNAPPVAHTRPPTPPGLPGQQGVGGADNAQGAGGAGEVSVGRLQGEVEQLAAGEQQ